MNLKKLVLNILRVIISMVQLKFEDTDFDILLDEKSYENILSYDVSCKTLFDVLYSIK